jgi:hypothetical protein
MQIRTFVLAVLLGAVGVSAQTSSAPLSAEEAGKVYVRRFSVGGSLTIVPIPMIPSNSTTVDTTTPAIQGVYQTTPASQWLGYGLTAQIAISGRFAVSGSLLLRRAGYLYDTEVYEGTLLDNSTSDTRKHTITHEDTRARYYDLPVTLRFYNKDRHTPGPRVFFEGGAAVRRVSDIRTSVTTSVNGSTPVCCDTTPAVPAHRDLRGVVAGFGVQLIDPIGIRVVPEVRYTRWAGDTFSSQSTNGQKNQIEAVFSLTF